MCRNTIDRSILSELSNTLSDLGGAFYNFGENLFEQIWYEKQELNSNLLDKLEHFFLFAKCLCKETQTIGFESIYNYRLEMGFITRKSIAGKAEWDLIRVLKILFSRQYKRFFTTNDISLALFGSEDFIHKVLQSSELKTFSELEITILNTKIRDLFNLENIKIAQRAIEKYLDIRYRSKFRNVYYGEEFNLYVSKSISSDPEAEIFELLRVAYSENLYLNPSGELITYNNLFKLISGRNHWINRIFKMKGSIPQRLLDLIYKKAREDLLHIYAPVEYNNLIYAMNKYRPQFREYFLVYEPLLVDHLLRYDGHNEYGPLFTDLNVMKLQWKVLRAQQRGMDMYDGSELPPSFARHHYRHNKADCRLHALVGIARHYNTVVEGKDVYDTWEKDFEDAKIRVEAGRPPKHWSPERRRIFIKNKIDQLRDNLFIYSYSLFS